MTIQDQLFTLLSTGATDAGARVHSMVAPDSPTKPYITYQRIIFADENVLSGNSGLSNTHIQIDCYATTYPAADALAKQVAALMAAWSVKNVSHPGRDLYEPTTKLFRVLQEFSIWH